MSLMVLTGKPCESCQTYCRQRPRTLPGLSVWPKALPIIRQLTHKKVTVRVVKESARLSFGEGMMGRRVITPVAHPKITLQRSTSPTVVPSLGERVCNGSADRDYTGNLRVSSRCRKGRAHCGRPSPRRGQGGHARAASVL